MTSHSSRQRFRVSFLRPCVFLGVLLSLHPTTLSAADPVYCGDVTRYSITINQGAGGLDAGDTVAWERGDGSSVSDLVFGTNAFLEIQAAIDAVDPGGTVQLAAGSYDVGSLVSVTKNLTLQGTPGTTWLSGGANADGILQSGEHKILEVSGVGTTVFINDLGFRNAQGGSQSGGAGINLLEDTEVTANRCTFSSCFATAGGAIYNRGQLNLNDSTFMECRGVTGGGAISNAPGATLVIQSSVFTNNSAQDGGAISNLSTATLLSCLVENSGIGSVTSSSGAGIFNWNGATITVTNSTFTGLRAEDGGAVANYGSANLSGCLITQCLASGSGGGIYNYGGANLTLSTTTFSENSAWNEGGAILNREIATVELVKCALVDGTASRGAGLLNWGTTTIRESSLANNTASSSGGGIQNNGILNASQCTFSGNRLIGEGGGGALGNHEREIQLPDGSGTRVPAEATVTNSTFSGNSASPTLIGRGGAVWNSGVASTVILNHCTIVENYATYGGGIYDDHVQFGSTTLTNSLVLANNADLPGTENLNGSGIILTGTNLTSIAPGTSLADYVGPLQNVGGVTMTRPLVTGSPAIDAGSNADVPAGLLVDQRGAPRVSNTTVDVGAFELAPQPQLTGITPAAGSRGLQTATPIVLTFSAGLVGGPGSILLRNAADHSDIPVSVLISGSQVTITIDPSANPPSGGGVYLLIEGDALAGTNGVPVSAVTDPSGITFIACFRDVYVDAPTDFLPANPSAGAVVSWRAGGSDAVGGLVFGINAFGSITEALASTELCTGGVIHLGPGVYDEGAELVPVRSLTLEGHETETTILTGNSDGNDTAEPGEHRVLRVTPGHNITLSQLTVRDGISTDSGGGIQNQGTLTLNHVAVTGCRASFGGGLSNQGGGTLTLVNSTVSGNASPLDGDGGGILNDGVLVVVQSTVLANQARNGGGIANRSGASCYLENVTLSGNTANALGGAILNNGTILRIIHATITSNRSLLAQGGGVFDTSVTLGGFPAPPPAFHLENTVIAGNTAPSNGRDVYATATGFRPFGVNFIGQPANATGFRAGTDLSFSSTGTTVDDLFVTSPNENGGPTATHLLWPHSPLVNGATTSPLTLDQRGFLRPQLGASDIGATEFQVDPDIHHFLSLDEDQDGNSLLLELALNTNPGSPDVSHPNNFSIHAVEGEDYVRMTFGRITASGFSAGPLLIEEDHLRYRVLRSTTLTPGSYELLYEFDGSNSQETLGQSILSDLRPGGFEIIDQSPPSDRAFYRLELTFRPHP